MIRDVSLDEIKTKIEEYIEAETPSAAVKVILLKEFKLNNDFTIEVPIGNKVEISMMQNIESQLLSFLRKSLKNTKINIQYNIEESQKITKPYTGAEILQSMIDRNPSLKKLKDDLGLDPDF